MTWEHLSNQKGDKRNSPLNTWRKMRIGWGVPKLTEWTDERELRGGEYDIGMRESWECERVSEREKRWDWVEESWKGRGN